MTEATMRPLNETERAVAVMAIRWLRAKGLTQAQIRLLSWKHVDQEAGAIRIRYHLTGLTIERTINYRNTPLEPQIRLARESLHSKLFIFSREAWTGKENYTAAFKKDELAGILKAPARFLAWTNPEAYGRIRGNGGGRTLKNRN